MAFETEYDAVRTARDQYGEGSPEHWAALAALRDAQGNTTMAGLNRSASRVAATRPKRRWMPPGAGSADDD